METISITAERLGVALDQIGPNDGALWELFASSFLAAEIPQMRAVGGLHDAGRDAFLYEPENEPGVYVQHSVQETFETKIRGTIDTLQNNGFEPRLLIYCSPRDLIKRADGIRRELRLKGIALDIRDRNYFVTSRNTSAGRVAVSQELATKLVDPLIQSAAAAASLPHALNETEERTAIAYFQISVPDRASDKSLAKLCYETLVRYASGTLPQMCPYPKRRSLRPSEFSFHLKIQLIWKIKSPAFCPVLLPKG